VATVSRDYTAKIWDLATGELKATLDHDKKVFRAAFSHDGKTLATGSEDRTARLWDVPTGKLKAKLQHKGTVWALSFSPDDSLIATASDNEKQANVWDAKTGKLILNLPGGRYPVAFSPVNQTLATGGPNKTVLLWDVP
jgi:WD40 repeat protein